MAPKNGLTIALGMLGIPNAAEAVKEIETLVSSGAIENIIQFGEKVVEITDAIAKISAQNAEILALLRSRDAEFATVASSANGHARHDGSIVFTGGVADDGHSRNSATLGEG